VALLKFQRIISRRPSDIPIFCTLSFWVACSTGVLSAGAAIVPLFVVADHVIWQGNAWYFV